MTFTRTCSACGGTMIPGLGSDRGWYRCEDCGSLAKALTPFANTCDYGKEVGNLHVIDYYLFHALRDGPVRQCFRDLRTQPFRFDPEDWSRYDGDLL